MELETPLLGSFLPIGLLRLIEQILRGEQVRLLEGLRERVLLPVGAENRLSGRPSSSSCDVPRPQRRFAAPASSSSWRRRAHVEVCGSLYGACGVGHLAPRVCNARRSAQSTGRTFCGGWHPIKLFDGGEQRIVPHGSLATPSLLSCPDTRIRSQVRSRLVSPS